MLCSCLCCGQQVLRPAVCWVCSWQGIIGGVHCISARAEWDASDVIAGVALWLWLWRAAERRAAADGGGRQQFCALWAGLLQWYVCPLVVVPVLA